MKMFQWLLKISNNFLIVPKIIKDFQRLTNMAVHVSRNLNTSLCWKVKFEWSSQIKMLNFWSVFCQNTSSEFMSKNWHLSVGHLKLTCTCEINIIFGSADTRLMHNVWHMAGIILPVISNWLNYKEETKLNKQNVSMQETLFVHILIFSLFYKVVCHACWSLFCWPPLWHIFSLFSIPCSFCIL